jgi:hypothetical protein
MTTPVARVALQYLDKQALEAPAGDTDLYSEPVHGWAMVEDSSAASTTELAREISHNMVLRLHGTPAVVHWQKGAVRAFSFHWSNGSAAWSVIRLPKAEFPMSQDGADFILFLSPTALSPLGSLWTIIEMKYVAKALRQHPGFAGSPEGGRSF